MSELVSEWLGLRMVTSPRFWRRLPEWRGRGPAAADRQLNARAFFGVE